MKTVILLDENGYFAGSTIMPDDTQDTDTMVSTLPPTGLHKPKYDRKTKKWVEGMTDEEIAELPPIEPTIKERIKMIQEVLDQMLMGGGANG